MQALGWGHEARGLGASYATGVIAIGYGTDTRAFGPLYLTSDGVYHNGMMVVPVTCPSGQQ